MQIFAWNHSVEFLGSFKLIPESVLMESNPAPRSLAHFQIWINESMSCGQACATCSLVPWGLQSYFGKQVHSMNGKKQIEYIYIYIYIYTYIYTYITYIHIHIHIHLHIHVHLHIDMHLHTHTYTHIHIHTYTHIHIYTYTHIHIYTYVSVYRYIMIYRQIYRAIFWIFPESIGLYLLCIIIYYNCPPVEGLHEIRHCDSWPGPWITWRRAMRCVRFRISATGRGSKLGTNGPTFFRWLRVYPRKPTILINHVGCPNRFWPTTNPANCQS